MARRLAPLLSALTLLACNKPAPPAPRQAPEPLSAAATPLVLEADLGEVRQEDEDALTQQIVQASRAQIERDYPSGVRPARRDQHPKAHGCVHGDFKVESTLAPNLAQGVFVPGKSYQAWLRFSNGDSNYQRADNKPDARGLAIKLLGVPGDKLLPAERAEQTQDFVLFNHPVFFIESSKDYLELIQKVGSSNPLAKLTVPLTLGAKGTSIVGDLFARQTANPLEVEYWSAVPYRLGNDPHKQAVKYAVRPCAPGTSKVPDHPGPNYLREAMVAELAAKDACFDFLVQARTSPAMSVENSMEEWKEADAPFVKVATLTVPKQVFTGPAQDEFCENLSYTPWHSLPEHRPLGSVNRVRRVVYEEISKLRHAMNHAPRREPTGSETF